MGTCTSAQAMCRAVLSAPQALHRAHCVGTPGELVVLRLYARGTLEERALQLAERQPGLELLCHPGPARNATTGRGGATA